MTTKPLVSQDEIDFDAFGQEPEASGLATAETQATQEDTPPQASVDVAGVAETRKAGEPEQIELLHLEEWWEPHWKGMPEFRQENCMPWKTLYVHFESRKDMEDFSKLVGQQIGLNTRFIWWPEATIEKVAHMRWVDAPPPPDGDEDDEIVETVEGEA
jgi:hypothetical protein